MTKENAHLFLPLVQALAEGKTIQYKSSSDQWIDSDKNGFAFNAPPDHYRIKPEPRKPLECWLYVTTADAIHRDGNIEISKPANPGFRLFREVIEPEEQ